jgi:hypothetical protein
MKSSCLEKVYARVQEACASSYGMHGINQILTRYGGVGAQLRWLEVGCKVAVHGPCRKVGQSSNPSEVRLVDSVESGSKMLTISP